MSIIRSLSSLGLLFRQINPIKLTSSKRYKDVERLSQRPDKQEYKPVKNKKSRKRGQPVRSHQTVRRAKE
jgi:hypothetical protein